MDFAGIVARTPANDSTFKVGDKVYGSYFGAFAEYIALDTRRGAGGVRKVPAGWGLGEACAVGASGAISLGCFLRAGEVRKGSWVLVTGATGGLGVVACQIARKLGAKVVALVGKEREKADCLKGLDVEEFVRYDEPGWEDKVKKITDGGVDLVYDSVGMVESSLKCCAYGGKVVIVGFAGRGGDIEKVRANRILLKSAAVLGYRFGEHGRRAPKDTEAIWQNFDTMVEEGSVKAVIYNVKYTGLKDIPKAMQDLANRKVWGRAVVTVMEENETFQDKPKL
jgi:NADPH:quinone reductase-like Zn-dependent oxidoreductase